MAHGLEKRAAEMLLNGATLLAEPCPYCSGVRVMKSGSALCGPVYQLRRRAGTGGAC